MKIIYLSIMEIMKTVNAILRLDTKCPFCGERTISMTPTDAAKRKFKVSCENEFYVHYKWGSKHYLVRQENVPELPLSIC